jgi:hypothetical protein
MSPAQRSAYAAATRALALAETDPVKADILHWIADNYAKPPSQEWLDAWKEAATPGSAAGRA